MPPTLDQSHHRRHWTANLILALFGVGLAGILTLLILTLFPQLRPGVIRYTVGQGDLFVHQPGWIAPPADPYAVLSAHPLAWDEDGFRVPAHPAEQYDVLALGDSFTEAANVARPWPDVLAAESGLAVRNMGFRGYGPVEAARVMETYGADGGAETVIIAYFEGNDLSNAISVEWSGEIILPAEARPTFEQDDREAWRSDYEGPFKYPISIVLNGQTIDYVFLEAYLSWLNGEVEDYAPSRNADAVVQSWADIVVAAGDACVIVAYLPSKAHIYTPYIQEPGQGRIMESIGYVFRQPDGVLRTLPEAELASAARSNFEDVVGRLDNQRNVIASLAADAGLPFADLTPAFADAAERSDFLYYVYDTHWNQAGHDLAGRVLADFLAAGPCG